MNRIGTAFGQVTGEFSFIKVPVLFSVIVVTINSGSNSKNRFATISLHNLKFIILKLLRLSNMLNSIFLCARIFLLFYKHTYHFSQVWSRGHSSFFPTKFSRIYCDSYIVKTNLIVSRNSSFAKFAKLD